MNTAIKIAVGVAAVAAIAGGAAFAAVTVFNGDDETPNTTPTTVETTAPVETPAPQPTGEPTEGADGVDAIQSYYDTFTEDVPFADGIVVASAGDITKDCGQEVAPIEGAYLSGYTIHYEDAEHTAVVEITCGWVIPSDVYDEFQQMEQDAAIGESGE